MVEYFIILISILLKYVQQAEFPCSSSSFLSLIYVVWRELQSLLSCVKMSASSSLKILISTTTFSLLLSYDVPRQKKMDRNEGKSLSVFQAIKWRNVCTYTIFSQQHLHWAIQHVHPTFITVLLEILYFGTPCRHNRASSEKDFLEREQIEWVLCTEEGQIAL